MSHQEFFTWWLHSQIYKKSFTANYLTKAKILEICFHLSKTVISAAVPRLFLILRWNYLVMTLFSAYKTTIIMFHCRFLSMHQLRSLIITQVCFMKIRPLIIIGPSGVGKGTIINHLLSRNAGLELAVSFTTILRA